MSRASSPSRSWRFHLLSYSLLVVVIVVLGANRSLLEGAQEGETAGAVATIDGSVITMQQLLDRAAPTLDQVEGQRLACLSSARENRHQVLENTVEVMVRETLSTNAAEKAGVPKGDWLAAEKERQLAAVTDDQIDTFYEENQARLRGTKEQLAPQIREYLGVEKLYADLRESADIDVALEPYRVEVATEDSPSYGPADAKVTLVEFSDFECPYCQRFNPTLEQVKEKYPQDVRIVFRQFPLNNIHPKAQKAAEASLCAHDQDAFWKMHDLLFEEQKDLDVEQLKEKAARLGLDAGTFDQCLDSGKYAAQVATDVKEGSSLGVTGTPSIFVNGRPLKGVVAFEEISRIIDQELEDAS